MISLKLKTYLSDVLGSPVRSVVTMSGGSICSANKLELEDDREYFLKWQDTVCGDVIEAEYIALLELSEVKGVVVPEIVHFYQGDNILPQLLVLEFLHQKASGVEDERELAKMLARLHRQHADSFGYKSDNFIGVLAQQNALCEAWGDFFVHNRLMAQTALARDGGWLAGDELEKFVALFPAIQGLLNALSDPPSLVHGDLWSGNILWSEEKGPVLIDPAIHYAHREVDIACTKFIAPLGDSFYDTYQDEYPMEHGYEVRFEIYNLYHTLTHANMFGGGYVYNFQSRVSELQHYLTS